MILIPELGTQKTQAILIALSLVSAWLALWPRRPVEIALGVLSATAAAVIAWAVPPLPWQLSASRRIARSAFRLSTSNADGILVCEASSATA